MVNKNNQMLFKFGTFAFLLLLFILKERETKKTSLKLYYFVVRFPLFQTNFANIAIIKKKR